MKRGDAILPYSVFFWQLFLAFQFYSDEARCVFEKKKIGDKAVSETLPKVNFVVMSLKKFRATVSSHSALFRFSDQSAIKS